MKVVNVLNQPGEHVVLYGERGVGKTSIANVIADIIMHRGGGYEALSVRVNCNTNDNFKTIWRKVFRELGIEIPDEWKYASPDPDDLRYMLSKVDPPKLIVLDEFDRIEDDEALSLMADTIKALSDHRTASKLVIVGVADSIDQLIGEHESIQRGISEVHVPRMDYEDCVRIVVGGLEKLDLAIVDAAQTRIARLSEGLPHYVHWLAQKAAQRAVADDRTVLTVLDVEAATEESTKRHSLVKEYQTAIQSPRRNNLFSRVLASCALAEKNLLGQFTSSAVREPMSRIMGRRYEIPAFARHLAEFTEEEHGSVLKKEGSERKYTYRFRNPLMQPFAIMAALSEGVIPEEYKAELFGA